MLLVAISPGEVSFLTSLNYHSLFVIYTGLCEAVCAHATALAAENAEYADSLKSVVEKLPEQRLQGLPSAFPRSQLAWVGGSVFASLKVRLSPAIRRFPLLNSLQ